MAGLVVHAVYQRLVSTAHMRDTQSYNKVQGLPSRSMSVQYECPIQSISNSWPLDAATKGWLDSCSQGAGRGVSGLARDLSLSCSPGLVGVVGDGSGGSRGSDLGSFGSLDFGCLSARGSHATRVCPQFSSFPGFASPLFCPQFSSYPGFASPPFPQSLKLPRVHHSPFPQFLQLPWGVTTSPPNFNGASRLVGLLRRGEEVHRPEAIASRVRFLRFRSPCECNLLPMGHWPPALNRVGSKGCIVPVATEWEPCPGSLTISPCGGASETHHWGAATRRFCSPCRRVTSGNRSGEHWLPNFSRRPLDYR